MKKGSKKTEGVIRMLVLALIVSLTAFAVPSWAGEGDGNGGQQGPKTVYLNLQGDAASDNSSAHEDPATFEKNFCLTPAQKEYTITKIQNVISKTIDPNMSDLEKYYYLAIWENKHAKYDNEFWSGTYDFSRYRHQWDSYGVLTDKSVCVGIAITYSVLCHAADLPCKFARRAPSVIEHTISYIPDINGNAYYVDITENSFFMSKYSPAAFEPIDMEFSEITKACEDQSLEYYDIIMGAEDEETVPANIKKCYKIPFGDWYREYAMHDPEVTDKEFAAEYEEKGSGLRLDEGGTHASYQDFKKYPAQPYASRTSNATGIWFLDDFYVNPEKAREMILDKEFDGQFLKISGLKDIYDCDDDMELRRCIENDIIVSYFPSAEAGKVVAWADDLKTSMDYDVKCKSFNKSKGEAEIAIESTEESGYNGSYQFTVKLKTENPMKLKGKTAAVKYSKLKTKAQTIKRSKAIKVSNAKGKLSYKLVSAKKGTKNITGKFNVNAKTGNVKIAKNLAKGTYNVNVKVRADGNSKYKASSWEKVTLKVKVK